MKKLDRIIAEISPKFEELSLGTVSNTEARVSTALVAPVDEARTYVKQQAVLHADETSHKGSNLLYQEVCMDSSRKDFGSLGGRSRPSHRGMPRRPERTLSSLSGIALAVLVAVAAGGCKKATKRARRVQTETQDAQGLTGLEIRNKSGDVKVVGFRSLKPVVKVVATHIAQGKSQEEAEGRLKKMSLDLRRDGTTLIVLVSHPGGGGGKGSRSDLRILVPTHLAVDADTSAGDVQVFGVTGRVAVRTGKGKVELRAVDGPVKAHSARGEVMVSGRMPSFEIESGGGKVTLHLRGRASLSEASAVRTKRGDVQITLNEQFNGRLSARAKGGKVEAPFPGLERKGDSLSGTMGDGGELLTVRTGRGDVEILGLPYTRIESVPQLRHPSKRRPRHKDQHVH